jgi:TolB-like protein
MPSTRPLVTLVCIAALCVGCAVPYRFIKADDEDAGEWTALGKQPRATTTAPVTESAVPAASPTTPVVSTARIAVLEISGGNLEPDLLRLLSDGLRAQALRVVKPRGMTVMTRESMLAILSDMGACTTPEEGTCEVETGRNIGADILVTGEVTKVGAQYFLTLKLFDVRSGSLLSTRSLRAKDGVGLVDAIENEGAVLFTDGLG